MSASELNSSRRWHTLRAIANQRKFAMNRRMGFVIAAAMIAIAPGVAYAQRVEHAEAIASSDVLSRISLFSYREDRKSDLFFRGTPIAALAQGSARVKYENGNAHISAKVERLPAPASLGPYAVYVLWTLTPDGRAVNQGVIVGAKGGKGKMDTQYGASQFALIVTAEPHFAVTGPSTMIVLYNVADDVKGDESKVTTLTERTDYSNLPRLPYDGRSSPEIVQARYAVAIARAADAERFAPVPYEAAKAKLADAETALNGKRNAQRKSAPGLGREAVVAAEDARRAAMIASAAVATETARQAAAADATRAANETATAAAELAEVADRESRTVERQQASAAAAATARSNLRDRLSTALPTRETERGLVADIGGVQFGTGTAEINGSARESIAKFSGIVASYPGLRFKVEGHTDSTGSVTTNNDLSLRRAITVRDYLIGQGVPASSIDVAGLGSSMPTGDNATAEGRARNRRVEIVVSGGPLAAN
jgi:outer membrane protein OmpA-like peptidoglycan-associated protein